MKNVCSQCGRQLGNEWIDMVSRELRPEVRAVMIRRLLRFCGELCALSWLQTALETEFNGSVTISKTPSVF